MLKVVLYGNVDGKGSIIIAKDRAIIKDGHLRYHEEADIIIVDSVVNEEEIRDIKKYKEKCSVFVTNNIEENTQIEGTRATSEEILDAIEMVSGEYIGTNMNRIKRDGSSRASIEELEEKLRELNKEDVERDGLKKELGKTKDKLEKLLREKEEAKGVEDEEKEKLKENIEEMKCQIEKILQDKAEVEAEEAMLKSSITKIKEELNNEKEANKKRELNNTEKSCTEDAEKSKEISKLLVDIEEVEKELNAEKREVKRLENRIIEYEDTEKEGSRGRERDTNSEVDRLNRCITDMAGARDGVIIPQIKKDTGYNIVTVFGLGSYGITANAIALAENLSKSSKVLYVDLDNIPRSDFKFKVSPMVSKTETSMSMLLNHSRDFFGNIDQYINNVRKKRKGLIDYFSGVYEKVEVAKWVAADYSRFLNTVGKDDYDYIVVDAGHIGMSTIQDSLIRVFTEVSQVSICVTQKDDRLIKLFKDMMDLIDIRADNIIWSLLSRTTGMSREVKSLNKNYLGAIIMPFNIDMFETDESLNNYKITAGNANELYSMVYKV